MTQATDFKIPALSIRIFYQGTCSKLTTRCRGDLTYKLGFGDATDNAYVCINAKVSSALSAMDGLDYRGHAY